MLLRRALLVLALVAGATSCAALGATSVKGFVPRVTRLLPPFVGLRVAVGPAVFDTDYVDSIRPYYAAQLESQLRAAGLTVVEASEPHDLVARLVGLNNSRCELRLEMPDGRPIDVLSYEATTGFVDAAHSDMGAGDWYDRLAAYVVEHLVNQLGASAHLRAYAIAQARGPGSALASAAPPAPPAGAALPPAVTTGSTGSGEAFVAASPQPAAYALVVGIEHYRDVVAAPGARADAERFARLARRTLGLREDHVRVAIEDHATRTDVEEGLKWLKDHVEPGGRVYFFFSGHGAPSADASTYLLPYDGSPRDVAGTALAMRDVMAALGQTRAHDVLAFVDSCFSGAGGRSVLPPGARPLVRVRDAAPAARIALFTASRGDEISGTAAGGGEGVFSKYVTAALGTGQADADGDGQISLRELVDWVAPRVARDAGEEHREQHPRLVVGSSVGDPASFIVEYGLPTR